MKRVGTWLAILFFVVLAAASEQSFAAPPATPTRQTVHKAAEAATRSLGAQTTMPGERIVIREENREAPREPSSTGISENFAYILLIVALSFGLVIILMTLRDNLWSASRSRRITGTEEEIVATDEAIARMDQAQVAAEELAQYGSFAEAMHVLLLQSVGEMRRHLDIAIAASLTSREILARIALPPAGQHALADIINRVEISYFGPHQPEAEDYEACCASFRLLTESLRTRVAA